MVPTARSERACGSFPMTWDPCGANVWTLSMVTASPPPKTMALVPNGAAAASWVATASEPAGATVPLTGKKRCTEADEFPPARPPRTRIVWPSATAEALDIAVRRPFAMGSTFNAGGLVDSVDVGGAVGVGDEAAPGGVDVAAGRPPAVPTLLVPPLLDPEKGLTYTNTTTSRRMAARMPVRTSRRMRRRRANVVLEYGGIIWLPPPARCRHSLGLSAGWPVGRMACRPGF